MAVLHAKCYTSYNCEKSPMLFPILSICAYQAERTTSRQVTRVSRRKLSPHKQHLFGKKKITGLSSIPMHHAGTSIISLFLYISYNVERVTGI